MPLLWPNPVTGQDVTMIMRKKTNCCLPHMNEKAFSLFYPCPSE